MNGRVYVQQGEKMKGWISSFSDVPLSISTVVLTLNVEESLVFDVDSCKSQRMLNSLIDKGYSVVIASSHIHRKPSEPSASPFSSVV